MRGRRPIRHVSSAVLVLIPLAGCGVPAAYQLRSGLDPQNQDTDVRFRTTYYFRTFDYCYNVALHGNDASTVDVVPGTDTLYRYRMTGQAHSLTTGVKFEAGTLQASEIDPFGTDIVYDPAIKGFLRRSPEEAKAEAARAGALDDFQRLAAQHAALSARVEKEPKEEARLRPLLDMLARAMEQRLQAYAGANLTPAAAATGQAITPTLGNPQTKREADGTTVTTFDVGGKSETEVRGNLTITLPADPAKAPTVELKPAVADGNARFLNTTPPAATEIACPKGATVRRGFQVMGPEGWRTFDQDERLLLAMYTGAEPLIATLQEYSGRVLNSRMNPAQALLPLVTENLRIVETELALRNVDAAKTPVGDIYTKALGSFTPAQPTGGN